jgi:hypothetical protein
MTGPSEQTKGNFAPALTMAMRDGVPHQVRSSFAHGFQETGDRLGTRNEEIEP